MNEIISTVISAVSAIAAMSAAIIAKRTLEQMRREQKEGLDRQKKQATLEAYNKLQEQVLDNINNYLPSEIRIIAEDKKSEDYKVLSGYLARIEHFCVGIETGIYDFETFYSLAHGYFDGDRGVLKSRLLPLLETKLSLADEDYYENLHSIWDKMDKKRCNGKIN